MGRQDSGAITADPARLRVGLRKSRTPATRITLANRASVNRNWESERPNVPDALSSQAMCGIRLWFAERNSWNCKCAL